VGQNDYQVICIPDHVQWRSQNLALGEQGSGGGAELPEAEALMHSA